jgi:hypothetical protein
VLIERNALLCEVRKGSNRVGKLITRICLNETVEGLDFGFEETTLVSVKHSWWLHLDGLQKGTDKLRLLDGENAGMSRRGKERA